MASSAGFPGCPVPSRRTIFSIRSARLFDPAWDDGDVHASDAPFAPDHGPLAPLAHVDPADMRRQYRAAGLLEAELAADPVQQFTRWFVDAQHAGLDEPNAMIVSTVDEAGRPSMRTVLLKGYDERGFVFYTNYESRKGREIAGNPHVALLFPWHPIARQVIVTGSATRVGRDETAGYFRSRPHGSQLGAWASAQSQPVDSRETLERRYADLATRYPEGEGVPVPPFWGGFRVAPESVEFWQGRENRLHDRLRYDADPTAPTGWRVDRLCP